MTHEYNDTAKNSAYALHNTMNTFDRENVPVTNKEIQMPSKNEINTILHDSTPKTSQHGKHQNPPIGQMGMHSLSAEQVKLGKKNEMENGMIDGNLDNCQDNE